MVTFIQQCQKVIKLQTNVHCQLDVRLSPHTVPIKSAPLVVLFYTKQIKADLLWLFHENKEGTSVNLNAKCWFADSDVLRLKLKSSVRLKQLDEKVFGSFRKSTNTTVKKIQMAVLYSNAFLFSFISNQVKIQ